MRQATAMNLTNHGAISLLALIVLSVACGPSRLYPGPQRELEEIAVLRCSDSARILRVDETEVDETAVELLPGVHTVEFSRSAGRMRSRSVVSMTCAASFVAEAGESYSFSAPVRTTLTRTREWSDPYRWTIYAIEPNLVARDGETIPGLECESTCRVHGKARIEEQNVPCRDSDKSIYDTSLRLGKSGPEEERAKRHVYKLWEKECIRRGDFGALEYTECLRTLSTNPIVFRHPNGQVLHFVPERDTNAFPGLRNQARFECGDYRSVQTLTECLAEFGWMRIQ